MSEKQIILDKETNKVPTIQSALDLVGQHGETIESWKTKALGLRQVLLGLAEVQALRISNLAGMVVKLEEELLSDQTIRELEPKQMFGLYRTATEQMQFASEYITTALKSMNWDDFQTSLLQAKAHEVSQKSDSGLSEMSGELLAALSRMKAEMGNEETK
jgi:hypothetical protein